MNDDELRHRLHRIDPAPDEVAMEAATTPSSRARLERIMSTSTAPSDRPADQGPASPTSRTRWLLAGAAAVLLVVGLLAISLTGGGDDEGDVAAGPPLELSLGAGDAMASCLPVEAQHLAAMPVAFAGTATAVEDERVTLDVDRWYRGGDAGVVQLHATSGQAALIAGFDFEIGDRYLISASEGSVSFCGFSGPETPELTALFDEAFGG